MNCIFATQTTFIFWGVVCRKHEIQELSTSKLAFAIAEVAKRASSSRVKSGFECKWIVKKSATVHLVAFCGPRTENKHSATKVTGTRFLTALSCTFFSGRDILKGERSKMYMLCFREQTHVECLFWQLFFHLRFEDFLVAMMEVINQSRRSNCSPSLLTSAHTALPYPNTR